MFQYYVKVVPTTYVDVKGKVSIQYDVEKILKQLSLDTLLFKHIFWQNHSDKQS